MIDDELAHWNHRAIRFQYPDDGTEVFEICEVFYGDQGEPDFFSDPQVPRGHSLEDLITTLGRWQVACAKPVLSPVADFGDTYDGPRGSAPPALRRIVEHFIYWHGDGCRNVAASLDQFAKEFSDALKGTPA